GKTTLCRVLSGILKSDQGEVSVDGDITALLSFGSGFNYQLTGKDNVYLNGMMLGIPKRKLKDVYGEIVEFSEIEKFMDQPVKNYSSGMRARLGFSIAASLRPDVFIIDEALSVGDMSFYEKASAKIQELMECAKAVIVVTHNMNFVETVCTRALWLDEGTIRFDGSPEEAVEMYRQSVKIGRH
ncbi:MAG: ABC transporter ATP-binding protein, partial [Deltaproteobacteria bacterium]|nr:ABC transporter ATP-binding protein [Deltaproteobacteria bacterium]